MASFKDFGFVKLAKKTLAVITASLGVLNSSDSKAIPQSSNFEEGGNKLNYENFQKKILKPKLVLKLNMNNPENSLLASHSSHRSHSSHSSHRSHSSHYSGSSGGYPSGGSSSGGDGNGLLYLGLGAAAAYGAYRIGKSRGNKKQ